LILVNPQKESYRILDSEFEKNGTKPEEKFEKEKILLFFTVNLKKGGQKNE